MTNLSSVKLTELRYRLDVRIGFQSTFAGKRSQSAKHLDDKHCNCGRPA